jgi:hypothetical protein
MLTVLMAFIHTGHQFLCCAFSDGCPEAGFFPAVVVYLTRWFRAADRAKAVAGFYAAMPLSYVNAYRRRQLEGARVVVSRRMEQTAWHSGAVE